MKYTEKMSNKLNELLEKNYDAEKGYKKAATIVENPQLKKFFENQAQLRYDFGHQLKDEIKNYGETPNKGTSIVGDLHRGWMSIKSTFSSNEEEAILEEVVKGEEAAFNEYKEIVSETTLPPTTSQLLNTQLESVKGALRNAKNFEVMVS